MTRTCPRTGPDRWRATNAPASQAIVRLNVGGPVANRSRGRLLPSGNLCPPLRDYLSVTAYLDDRLDSAEEQTRRNFS